jgi:DNA-3-methyladenine glycosylase
MSEALRAEFDINVKIFRMSFKVSIDVEGIQRISRHAVPADTVELARWLLGKVLVRQPRGKTLAGRIVETEAYLVGDPACHGFRGVTPRNGSLFLEHGHCYVYICYGTSHMLNVSSESRGIGAGVLIRAIEPLHGHIHMRRGRRVKELDLARGPGRLTQAFDVDMRHDGLDLFAGKQLWIGKDDHEIDSIGRSVRIGLTKAADKRLRFYIRGNRFLSGTRALNR